MTGHTPAPWRVTPELVVTDANGNEVAAVAIAAQLVEAGTNARLIAAAPDLLEALQLLSSDSFVESYRRGHAWATIAIGKARNAIAKATGAQS